MATRHLKEKFEYRGVTVVPLLAHKYWPDNNGFPMPVQFFDIVEPGSYYSENSRWHFTNLGEFWLTVTRPTQSMCMRKVDEWLERQAAQEQCADDDSPSISFDDAW